MFVSPNQRRVKREMNISPRGKEASKKKRIPSARNNILTGVINQPSGVAENIESYSGFVYIIKGRFRAPSQSDAGLFDAGYSHRVKTNKRTR